MSSMLYTKEYQHFVERLKRARMLAKLTQQEAAKHLKKRQTYISKCEQGERRIDVLELKKFAHLYKKPLAYFLP